MNIPLNYNDASAAQSDYQIQWSENFSFMATMAYPVQVFNIVGDASKNCLKISRHSLDIRTFLWKYMNSYFVSRELHISDRWITIVRRSHVNKILVFFFTQRGPNSRLPLSERIATTHGSRKFQSSQENKKLFFFFFDGITSYHQIIHILKFVHFIEAKDIGGF